MRITIFILLIVLATFIGSLYGSLYEQITYSVSEEFFTKVRFQKYGVEGGDVNNRWEAAKIGVIYTWKVGLVLGIFLSLAGLLHTSNRKMFFVTLQSFFITLITSFIFGILALLLSEPSVNISNEINVIDKAAFNKVLSMNNYSYVGGVIGMFIGLGWQVLQTRRNRKKNTPAL